ncbi:MAG: ImmA/IrrE family metallo-endopeptidase [Patescibacteria group bacterium]|nr:ImmA/IrrE family metallo-endopeptidase [Patescibacteria group bacterium]
MQQIRDTLHGLGFYPRYTEDELDFQFQKYIFDFLRKKYKTIELPLTTDDLTLLIENDVKNLDLYSDLGEDIEGETSFTKNEKPSVGISKMLTDSPDMENRYRMTLAHEYGHVKLHNFIVQIKSKFSQKCKRESISGNTRSDWMEWQAFYAGGALLMPIIELKKIVSPLLANNLNRLEIITIVANKFKVSTQAAEVRLRQKHLTI